MINGKQIIIGLATFEGREEALKIMLKSIQEQTIQPDHIYLYDNSKHTEDLTDNGKFRYLENINQPAYYFSMDDDLKYHRTYIEDMIKAVDEYKCIVTHHGRKLLALNRNYYRGHKAFHCLHNQPLKQLIDVAGTGVTAFDTSYFKPDTIYKSKDMRMSDLIFSLEAAKQNKDIMVLSHIAGYIQQIDIDHSKSCFTTQLNNCDRQNQIANEIINIKNRK